MVYLWNLLKAVLLLDQLGLIETREYHCPQPTYQPSSVLTEAIHPTRCTLTSITARTQSLSPLVPIRAAPYLHHEVRNSLPAGERVPACRFGRCP